METEAQEPAHPGPEELECFDREPAGLAPERSDFIAAHLRTCSSCADELNALRAHSVEAIEAIEASAKESGGSGWRRILWNPAFGLVLVGLLAFPVLYRNLGLGGGGTAPEFRQDASDLVSSDAKLRSRENAVDRPLEPQAGRSGPQRDESPVAKRARIPAPAPARPASAPPAIVAEAVQPASPEAADRPHSEQSQSARSDEPPSAKAREPVFAEAAEAPLAKKVAPTFAADEGADLQAGAQPSHETIGRGGPSQRAQGAAQAIPRKSVDPLAHHVFIPTMRLRPGQSSWGPISDLRAGFFLEIPLPRGLDAGHAQVLILPEGLKKDAERRRESLSAENRALDSLAGRIESESAAPREFQERVPVESKQRFLMLQIPADVFEAGRYRVELEVTRDAGEDVQGRGRFRLELLDE